MPRQSNLPPGCSSREIEDPAPSSEAEQCNGQDCETMVEPDEPHYSTYCGTFCQECMADHVAECEICRKEF